MHSGIDTCELFGLMVFIGGYRSLRKQVLVLGDAIELDLGLGIEG